MRNLNLKFGAMQFLSLIFYFLVFNIEKKMNSALNLIFRSGNQMLVFQYYLYWSEYIRYPDVCEHWKCASVRSLVATNNCISNAMCVYSAAAN